MNRCEKSEHQTLCQTFHLQEQGVSTPVVLLKQEANSTVGHVVGGEAPLRIASLR